MLQQLIKTLLEAAQLEAQLSGRNVSEKLTQQLTMWGAGIFRLVVMGEIKKGKSSFINAMLGEENLVPVSSDVATSTIFKIRYGETKGYTVHFLEESGKKPLRIDQDDLARFGTEDGNPGNKEQVEFIEVVTNNPVLKSGLVIIDTPGLGGLFKAHKQITYQYVPRADAVFFVTDSVESPIGSLEIEYLKNIRENTKHLYFVQTKTCAVDAGACEMRRRNNLTILSQHLGVDEKKIPYFLVDSKLRFEAKESEDMEDLQDSGYPTLMSFFNDVLQPRQQLILAERALRSTQPILSHLQDHVRSKKELLAADTQKKRQEQIASLNKAQEELKQWIEMEHPKIIKELTRGFQQIQTKALEQCNLCRPGGEIQMHYENMIFQVSDIDSLSRLLSTIQYELPGKLSELTQKIADQVQQEVSCLLTNLGTSCSQNSAFVYRGNNKEMNAGIGRITNEIENRNSFSDIKNALINGSLGANIGMAAGAVIGSIVPFVGTAVGGVLGGIIGGWLFGTQGLAEKKQQELTMRQQCARNEVNSALSSAYSQIQLALNSLLSDLKNKASDAVNEYLKDRKNELQDQIKAINERGKMTDGEINQLRQEIKVLEDKLLVIQRVVSPWLEKIA